MRLQLWLSADSPLTLGRDGPLHLDRAAPAGEPRGRFAWDPVPRSRVLAGNSPTGLPDCRRPPRCSWRDTGYAARDGASQACPVVASARKSLPRARGSPMSKPTSPVTRCRVWPCPWFLADQQAGAGLSGPGRCCWPVQRPGGGWAEALEAPVALLYETRHGSHTPFHADPAGQGLLDSAYASGPWSFLAWAPEGVCRRPGE